MEYLEYFERFPDAYAKIVKSLNRIETLYQYLRACGLLQGVKSVLSIGSGDAAVEIRLAGELGFELGVVEPAEDYLKKSLAGAEAAGIRLREAHHGSFQSYQSHLKYDLVLSLYSWFAFGFDRQVLEKALSCRAPGGKLVICLQGEASPSTQISGLSRASGINLTSEKISQWATELGFDHRVEVYHGVVPAPTYLDNRGLTQTGRDLVSFLLATPWDDVTPELRAKTLGILQESLCDGNVDFESPCLIFE